MTLSDEAATLAAGARLAVALRAGDVVTLDGALAAGKTTLVRGLLAELGHPGEVPSPSFAIVQPYDALVPPVWHVDLYRIENPAALAELGLDEIREDGVLIVEWPDRAGADAWPDALALSLTVAPDGARVLTAKVPPSWEGRWPR
ncbi:tRNA (adenosine(37)-N6)-threonylcarbamoyltransferase complex ATPase subunit type 1 TsaE [Sphingomonas sp. LY29]|uniref:tRNA (adenosine(37)-N6)-threonylcarbamoyltransferase complex ATPase subunit type 1 TsaE n=1 Tax=Sphingomonas sp. LY29 TaxID=3095341 RepID=UPI002D784D15|nr:tRNA (adenosine(37)-N6)-threonylcarbamoyltransferase complex ATPase subunit type 1 TsaE [Sphingomonas sp. LY29]WRP26049.1 tRNA (adenosine(37)-N6)-threonylcarbamoyltransferase complex ATPase subunit type 1 TsaE [Sphingomonas sp. LY29]